MQALRRYLELKPEIQKKKKRTDVEQNTKIDLETELQPRPETEPEPEPEAGRVVGVVGIYLMEGGVKARGDTKKQDVNNLNLFALKTTRRFVVRQIFKIYQSVVAFENFLQVTRGIEIKLTSFRCTGDFWGLPFFSPA